MVSPKTTYLPALTALRGIAALWVVMFHIDVIIYYRDLGTVLDRQYTGLLTQGYLWVDFFFVLSGFIICHTYGAQLSGKFEINPVLSYLRARFLRIYPLHLFTLVLVIIFSLVISTYIPSAIDGSWHSYFDQQALLSNFMLTNAMSQHNNLSWNIVSWSIGAEWWVYVIAVSLLYFVSTVNRLRLGVILGAACAGLALLVYYHPKQSLDITFDFGLLRCLFEFTIGAITYQAFKQQIAIKWLQRDRYLLAILITLVTILHLRLPDLMTIPLFALLTLAAAYNQGTGLRILSSRLAQFIGRISFSIYLMHGVWFMVFWFLLPIATSSAAIESLSSAQIAIYVGCFLTLTILSAMLSYRYIERPSRYLFKNKQPLTTHNSSRNTL